MKTSKIAEMIGRNAPKFMKSLLLNSTIAAGVAIRSPVLQAGLLRVSAICCFPPWPAGRCRQDNGLLRRCRDEAPKPSTA